MDYKVKMYTDGASKGNPGPSGIGIVLIYNNTIREIGKPISPTTNNRAELTAIVEGLSSLKSASTTEVTVYTDSQLVVGFISKGWKAKVNVHLVSQMQRVVSKCKKVKVEKVKGHSGNKHNTRADQLAKEGSINKITDRYLLNLKDIVFTTAQ